MSIQDRPFTGSWQPRSRTVVRHTPDAVVYINGYQEFAGCNACEKRMDFQKYITQVSVDASTDPISTGNVTLSIPRAETGMYTYDGNHILQVGLEVVILMRGYFPMDMGELITDHEGEAEAARRTEAGEDISSEEAQAEIFDRDNSAHAYPYYQVFRGVVTNVSHEYSGGFYSATLQCANLLHFWQYLKLSVNGAVFGPRPDESMVSPHLLGHKFIGANPYAIIYTLVRVGFGAAFGVDYTYSQSTNIAAVSENSGTSMYAHAGEWWEKRWTENSGNLRMYGISGELFNGLTQAYLGAWYDSRHQGIGNNGDDDGDLASSSRLATNPFYSTVKRYTDIHGWTFNHRDYGGLMRYMREVAYDPLMTASAVYNTNEVDASDYVVENVLAMQAFTLDIGQMGSINEFETEYMSKLEIAAAVTTLTGFEFYQDVDGDLVFKPPMYNLDTRQDPVYIIKDRDLISISETETEPEVTMMKGTGSHFANMQGHGVEGWMGVGGVFVDYRLVAQFGYRDETFEANYFSDRQAIFLSAINRLDAANVGMKSANITIPLRPEMRPGYPVYIESQECFYYAKSVSHSFTFGGQCTTSINGVAKRTKWFPPMQNNANGLPTPESIRLDSPGELPSLPMVMWKEDGSRLEVQGMPNVVLALDPNKLNYQTLSISPQGLTYTWEWFMRVGLQSGLIQRNPAYSHSTNTYGGSVGEYHTLQIPMGNGEFQTFSPGQLERLVTTTVTVGEEEYTLAYALHAGIYEPVESEPLAMVLAQINQRFAVDMADSQLLRNRMHLIAASKSMFSPGTSLTGQYRYFSSHAADTSDQAPQELVATSIKLEGSNSVDIDTGTVGQQSRLGCYSDSGPPDADWTTQVRQIETDPERGGMRWSERRELRTGIKILNPSQKGVYRDIELEGDTSSTTRSGGSDEVTVATGDIRFITFTKQTFTEQLVNVRRGSGWGTLGAWTAFAPPCLEDAVKEHLLNNGFSGTNTVAEAFVEAEVPEMVYAIYKFMEDLIPYGGIRYDFATTSGYNSINFEGTFDEDTGLLSEGSKIYSTSRNAQTTAWVAVIKDATCYSELAWLNGRYTGDIERSMNAAETSQWGDMSMGGADYAVGLPVRPDQYDLMWDIDYATMPDDAWCGGMEEVDTDAFGSSGLTYWQDIPNLATADPSWWPTAAGYESRTGNSVYDADGVPIPGLNGSYKCMGADWTTADRTRWDTMAGITAAALCNWLERVCADWVASVPPYGYLTRRTAGTDWDKVGEVWTLLNQVQDRLVRSASAPALSSPAGRIRAGRVTTQVSCSPVFPVSDGAGYEVYGTMPYGRGISIATMKDLLESKPSGSCDEDSGSAAAANAYTAIGGTGANPSSLRASEQFWANFMDTLRRLDTDAGVLRADEGRVMPSDVDARSRAELAARIALGTTTLEVDPAGGGVRPGTGWQQQENAQGLLNDMRAMLASSRLSVDEFVNQVAESIYPSEISPGAFIRNRPVTSFTRGQSIYGNFAATNLADLGFSGACEKFYCKGADGSLFLASMGADYVDILDSPLVQVEQANNAVLGAVWETTRSAISGETEDPTPTIGEAFKDAAKHYSGMRKGLEELDEELRSTVNAAIDGIPGVSVDSKGNVDWSGYGESLVEGTVWEDGAEGFWDSWESSWQTGYSSSGPIQDAIEADRDGNVEAMSTEEIQTWLLESPMNIGNLESEDE